MVGDYKDRLLLSPLDRPSKPASGSIRSKHQTLAQLDVHIHNHSISISSEPRSLVALQRERGLDTHIFLPAPTRAQIFHKRNPAYFLDQSAQFSIFQHTDTRQHSRISALLATIRSHRRNRSLFLWTWLHPSQLHARFTRRLDVTTSGLHHRNGFGKRCLRPVRAFQAIEP
jgi:hypothetical protein